MAFTLSDVVHWERAGVKYQTRTITETSVGTSTEWNMPLPTGPKTITLYDATLTGGSGSTVQPKIGTATNPTAGAAGYLDQVASAAAFVRGPENIRLDANDTTLFGRSTPDTGSDNAVTTRVTIALAHL